MRQRLYYFYGSFKPEFFMWEAVGFAHKALLAVIAAWNTDCSIQPQGCDADVNDAGVVNVGDLLLVIAQWGCVL